MNLTDITYTDKETMNENAEIPAINKCQASDLNEIKNVINANNDMLTPVVLYNNPTNNTVGDITLSENPDNYSYLEIYARTNGSSYIFIKIDASYKKFDMFTVDASTLDNYWINIKNTTFSINGLTISPDISRELNVKGTTREIRTLGTAQKTFITKVIGIK